MNRKPIPSVIPQMPPVKKLRQADELVVPRSFIEQLANQEHCLVHVDDDRYHFLGWECHFCGERVHYRDDHMVHDDDCTVTIARKLLGENP